MQRLVIAYAFAPYADTSAIVAAKRVREQGEPVDLLQNEMSELRGTDPTLERVAGSLIQQRAVLETQTRFGSWSSVRAFCDAGMETIEGWESTGRRYTSVYSRAHFIASHLLAARYVLRHPGVAWEAEFSDPLSVDSLGDERTQPVAQDGLLTELTEGLRNRQLPVPEGGVHRWGEQLALLLADRLVFTNAAQRDYVLGRYDEQLATAARDRSTVSGHPQPPAELYQAVVSDQRLSKHAVNIGYFGNFYDSQHPETVLAACGDLSEQDRQRVRLHVFTSDPERIRGLVDDHHTDDVVQVHQRLDYLEFLNLAQRMDVLLAMDAATPASAQQNPTMLSKWSDYAGSGTPVWGVVQAGSDLATRPLAYRSPLRHRTAALQVLTSLARHRTSSPARPSPSRDADLPRSGRTYAGS